MYKLEAVYRVVTPLFAGSAEPDRAELRAPGFKGALRFWYRAMALSLYKDWKKVRFVEQQLFGSTDGQAAFILKVLPVQQPVEVSREQTWSGQGSAYLGYGVIGRNNRNTKPYLKESFRFTATLVMPVKRANNVDTQGLKKALIALGLFGGLGSRSRKGFGSLVLESLVENGQEIWTTPQDAPGLRVKVQELFQDMQLDDVIPDYSAFTQQSRIVVWPSNTSPLELLDAVGREMVRYRSYGQSRGTRRVVLGNESAEQNFVPDHDLAWHIAQGNRSDMHPQRLAFGLPHNYFFFSTRQKVDVNGMNSQRRASPLFIHIHQLSNGCAAVFTMLPARFLPEGDMVKISGPQRNVSHANPQVDYNVLHNFINRFPGGLEVLP